MLLVFSSSSSNVLYALQGSNIPPESQLPKPEIMYDGLIFGQLAEATRNWSRRSPVQDFLKFKLVHGFFCLEKRILRKSPQSISSITTH